MGQDFIYYPLIFIKKVQFGQLYYLSVFCAPCTMVRADMSSHLIRRTLWASMQLAVVFDLSWFIISTRFFNKKLAFTLSILTSIWYLYFSYITKPCPLVPFTLKHLSISSLDIVKVEFHFESREFSNTYSESVLKMF